MTPNPGLSEDGHLLPQAEVGPNSLAAIALKRRMTKTPLDRIAAYISQVKKQIQRNRIGKNKEKERETSSLFRTTGHNKPHDIV